jgi:omega-6 fatty acid desaturase (delta-12 desaturase)
MILREEVARSAAPKKVPVWRRIVAKYETPSIPRGVWQAANTLIPYFVLWGLIHWALSISFWLAAPLMLLAAGFLVRVFIIFHDCGHGSFFRSRKANDMLGFITGVLLFTPYQDWRHQHAMHHATANNLDAPGSGEVPTMTVREYLAAGRWRRFGYRLVRNPFFLFTVAPIFMFALRSRFPTAEARKRERWSVLWTNLALLAVGAALSALLGVKEYLLIQGAILIPAASAGMWLFFVQHQFEGAYRERGERWDFVRAALRGSSYYKLPKVLQWFTGNIGFHHIHHLDPRIPNYRLGTCHKQNRLFRAVKPLTLLASLRCLTLKLWDEQRGKLVGFSQLSRLR